jgi:2-polyprenyl-3-methyl-5-hydroxy-6-metoxy-1,4-benzoquinol methylase
MPESSPEAAEMRESWTANADAWTRTVRAGTIASRRLVTDGAVIEAVTARSPRRVLDLGCGEGWLARALSARGAEVTGIDASAPLIEAARRAGGGTFAVLGYEELAADPARAGTGYDLAVANFALLQEDPAPLLRALRRAIAPDGALVVQTVHPMGVPAPYRDGWRVEDFRAFDGGADAWAPMPWFFRTLGSWLSLLRASGYTLEELREPLHPETSLPASLLLTAVPLP